MSTPRPNILLLHTDQQRFDTIAALGAGHLHTPGLDRLAAGGTAFLRAYSSNPVCMPARHDLITGASARHHGYYYNQNTVIKDYALATVPRLLTEAGYQTVAVGKMHFHPEREHHGFAQMHLMEELPSCRENDAYLQYLERAGLGRVRCQHGVRPLFYHIPQPSRVPEEHHGSAWIAHQTIDLIRGERDRPFFIFASWVGPHPPYYVPRKYLDMYRGKPLPPPCPAQPGPERQTPPSPENPELGDPRLTRLREAYFAAVTLIDAQIGRILDALAETGQLDDTLIIFTSDHGEMLGDRCCYQKVVPYEGSAHIPLILSGPGVGTGARSAAPATTWDVAATILDAAGVEPPREHPLVGASLLAGETRDPGRIVVFHHGRGHRRYVAAVGRAHKFVHWYNGGEEELYDLEGDPWEQSNLLEGETRPADELAAVLRQACLEFERRHGIAAKVKNDAFVDEPYEAPDRHAASIHPPWSYRQFPPWMTGYAKEDLDAIAAEMRDCLQADRPYICREPEWRAKALEVWQGLGGDPAVYEELFAAADAKGWSPR